MAAASIRVNKLKQIKVQQCLQFPPNVGSHGLLSTRIPTSILGYTLPRLEMEIALLFVFTQIFHRLLKRSGVPVFVSQMMAGIAVGAVVNLVISKDADVEESNAILLGAIFSSLGYGFYMFQNGVKTDLGMAKTAGKFTICIGILTVLLPLIASVILLRWLEPDDGNPFYRHKGLFLTLTYSLTSFPAIVDLLSDLEIMNSELGKLALSAAIVGDVISLLLFIGNALYRLSIIGSFQKSFAVVAFILVVVLLVRPAMSWVVRRTPQGRPVNKLYTYMAILLCLIVAYLTQYFHQFLLFGLFALGLAVPNGPPLGSALDDMLNTMVSNLFLPLFVSSTTMRIDFSSSSLSPTIDALSLPQDSAIFLFTLLFKFLSCYLLSMYCKLPKSDALTLSLIMNAKGIESLGWYSFMHDDAVITTGAFKLMAFSIMGLSIILPVMIRKLYDPSRKYAGYRKRNIMNSYANSELRIMACIHVPNNVNSVINLLNVSSPTRDNPISLHVLHLIKLSGRSTPLLISHNLQPHDSAAASSPYYYSENVIASFLQFELRHWGAISLHAYTAISPPRLMHEDVCTLALDKLACFVILPFHRRWYIDGSVESDDHTIMALNWSVFKRAPCSAGILIDRGHIQRAVSNDSSSSPSKFKYRIAMIFLGGSDDREGLTLARRMAQEIRVSLTVLHLYASGSGGEGKKAVGWDHMLDLEVLNDIKDNNGYVRYIHREVKDGQETSSILGEMVNDYELIIVGRRFGLETKQTSGLQDWIEFPQLGILGDLLASSDFHGNFCALVVQQQSYVSESLF